MTPALWTLAFVAACYVVGTVAYLCARRADYHRGKAEAFSDVARDWQAISNVARATDKEHQKRERKGALLRMALCQREVCDAMEEALVEARRYWKHPEPET